MHLTTDEILQAAEVAARRFGSNDPAIDHDDFVSIAYFRILKRNPENIGTAVFCGREAIGKVIGQPRYKNQYQKTCRGEHLETSGRTPRSNLSTPEKKKRKHSWEIIRKLGRPIEKFGRYGVVYPESAESDLRTVYFDPIRELDTAGNRRLRLLMKDRKITSAIRELADNHYVLLLVPDGKKWNAKKAKPSRVARRRRQKVVQKDFFRIWDRQRQQH